MRKPKIKLWPDGDLIKLKIVETEFGESYEKFSGKTGIPVGTINLVVSGKQAVMEATLQRFADAFGCKIEDISFEKKPEVDVNQSKLQKAVSGVPPSSHPSPASNPTVNTMLIFSMVAATSKIQGIDCSELLSNMPSSDSAPTFPVGMTTVSGINLYFNGSLNSPELCKELSARMLRLADALATFNEALAGYNEILMFVQSVAQGSIIVSVTMIEADTIRMARAFSAGRLDEIGLFRIEFTERTPRLIPALAEIEWAAGDTKFLRGRPGIVLLVRDRSSEGFTAGREGITWPSAVHTGEVRQSLETEIPPPRKNKPKLINELVKIVYALCIFIVISLIAYGYTILDALFFEAFKLTIAKFTLNMAGALVAALAFALVLYGFYNARNSRIVKFLILPTMAVAMAAIFMAYQLGSILRSTFYVVTATIAGIGATIAVIFLIGEHKK